MSMKNAAHHEAYHAFEDELIRIRKLRLDDGDAPISYLVEKYPSLATVYFRWKMLRKLTNTE